jgi:hypothetical protein
MAQDMSLSINKYMTATPPPDATPVQVVKFFWTEVSRTPEFLKHSKDKLRKEWPELWDALNLLASAEGEKADHPIHFIEAPHQSGHNESEATGE